MRGARRCTVCGEPLTATNTIDCENCGCQLHDACVDYYETFDCRRCGTDLAVGAVEL